LPDYPYDGGQSVLTPSNRGKLLKTIPGRRPKPPTQQESSMAQNHYTTKTKRRQKSGKRKDPAAATMAKLRELRAAEAKKLGK